MLEVVPSRIKIVSRRPKYLARALNSVLLLLIFYGATYGLVHSHTIYPPPFSTSETTLGGAREADLTTKLLSTGKNCLLCQFHQQLSHGLFQASHFSPQPSAHGVRLLDPAFNNYSAPHESSRGRAPPVASLL